ncbi:MAG TPA: transaldolase [Solirubrobacteraceae bacterium]|jgi:transaldolase|nr:transaldolase [Solirubrobacteraceae bacterium]
MGTTPLQQLAEHGQAVWIDYLSRPFVKDGDLEGLIRQGIVGATSNPTIFQGAIAEGDAYDDQIRELVDAGITEPKDVFLELARDDIRDACDLFEPVWDEGSGKDGWVSLEVDPNLAHDTQGTIEEAKRLHAMVERDNLLIKIPATVEGLEAIEETIAAGIPVNVTLIFSLERHRDVAEAYVRGLQRFVDGGGDPSRNMASVASFFVSRVDTEADKRLDEAGGHDELKGTLAIANAKLAYQTYKEVFSGEQWDALAAKGASPQRCLWASTSTKNPEYRDVIYVEELVGPDTVNTMPRETVEAVLDHGEIRGDTLAEDLEGARKVLDDFKAAGIDYDDVVATLEREGVEKFAKSFRDLFSDLESKRDALVGAKA